MHVELLGHAVDPDPRSHSSVDEEQVPPTRQQLDVVDVLQVVQGQPLLLPDACQGDLLLLPQLVNVAGDLLRDELAEHLLDREVEEPPAELAGGNDPIQVSLHCRPVGVLVHDSLDRVLGHDERPDVGVEPQEVVGLHRIGLGLHVGLGSKTNYHAIP